MEMIHMGLIDKIRTLLANLKTRIATAIADIQEDSGEDEWIDFGLNGDPPVYTYTWQDIWTVSQEISTYYLLFRQWQRTVEPLSKADIKNQLEIQVTEIYNLIGISEDDIAYVKQFLSVASKLKDAEDANIEDFF